MLRLSFSCFDDLGKMLALSRSTALMAPFYPLLLTGEPLAELLDVTSISDNIAAWSGIRNSTTLLLAVTPSALPSFISFSLQLDGGVAHTCTNLETLAAVAMQQTRNGIWTCDTSVQRTAAFKVV
jgi:hypothetical protein